MRSRQILGMIVLLPFVFIAANPNVVLARPAALSMDTPLTPQEQAARLWELAGQTMARKLFPSTPESVKSLQHDYQHMRGNVSQGSLKDTAQKMGEKGGAWYAAKHGLIELLGAGDSGILTGPDSVYLDPYSGRVFVLETKGGYYAKIEVCRGARQNTNRYSIGAAEGILKSPLATRKAKVAAARIIVAAQEGRLVTGAIETRPKGDPLLTADKWDITNVAREAHEIERNNPDAQKNFRRARLAVRMTQGVAIAGFAGALVIGRDAYRQARVAWPTFDDAPGKGDALLYMQTGVAFGRMAQATSLGVISTAQLGIWKLSASVAGAQHTTAQAAQLGIWKLSARGVVRAAGGALIPVTLGVEGLQFAMVHHQHGLGRISQREFYRRSTGPAIAVAFTAGGAVVGGIIGGVSTAGAGALPIAMAGATIGALVAIPVHSAANFMLDRHYQEFDEQQRRVVNAAVETFYGFEVRNEIVQR